MSVSPTVNVGQLGSHWTDFYEILHLSIFLNSVATFEVPVTSCMHNLYFT